MSGFSDIKRSKSDNPVIKVVGVGGGGGNVIDRMIQSNVRCVEFIAANTDLQDLKNSAAVYKLQLGVKCTQGLGSGAKPNIGRQAALESVDLIREALLDTDMVFVTAGMGGGTGTGGAPVIAQLAKEAGILTVGVVTLPFQFEGRHRLKNAQVGIQELQKQVDTLIVIPNNNLLNVTDKKTSMIQAFAMADDILRQAIQGISDLITNDGIINLDFADVRTVMKGKGKAVMGTGIASGESRAREAAEKAINSPLLDNYQIKGARGILINVVGSPSMTLHEVTKAATFIEEQADEDATIVWGASINPDLNNQIMITVIATGFDPDPVAVTEEAPAHKNVVLAPPVFQPSIPSFFSPPRPAVSPSYSISKEVDAFERKADSQPLHFSEFSLKDSLFFEEKEVADLGRQIAGVTEDLMGDSRSLADDLSFHNLSSFKQTKGDSSLSGGGMKKSEDLPFAHERILTQETVATKSTKSQVRIEDVETSPKYPDWAFEERNSRSFMDDLDIPAFIRRRNRKTG